jgi:hypothetical protein
MRFAALRMKSCKFCISAVDTPQALHGLSAMIFDISEEEIAPSLASESAKGSGPVTNSL